MPFVLFVLKDLGSELLHYDPPVPPSRRDFIATGLAVAGLSVRDASALAQLTGSQPAPEDGSRLWLRFMPPAASAVARYRQAIRRVRVDGTSPTLRIIETELTTALSSMLGGPIRPAQEIAEGTLLAGTPRSSPAIQALGWDGELTKLGDEGFVIRRATVGGRPVLVIASAGEIGALYGAFHFLRLLQVGQPIDRIDVAERPRLQLRLLNHWDRFDGSIERGYAGNSLWQWNELPDRIDPRYAEYARANASIGINGAAPNNVNADARMLSAGVPRQSRGAGRRVASLRRADVSLRECGRADSDRGTQDRGPAGSRRCGMVEGESRRDLQAHS